MRRTIVLLGLAAATASPALAQSNRGAFGLDAFVAPTTGLGFSYYVTDGLSLRPWLGLGYSDYSGFFANLGAQLRYEFGTGDLSPYLSAVAQYSHNGSVTRCLRDRHGLDRPPGQPTSRLALASDLGQFGAGAGLRYRVSGSVSLFGEGRVMYATSPLGTWGAGWSTIDINDRTRAEVVLGLSVPVPLRPPRDRPLQGSGTRAGRPARRTPWSGRREGRSARGRARGRSR